jgi:hypothetical protein
MDHLAMLLMCGEGKGAEMGKAFRVVQNNPAMRQIISQEKRQQIIAALKDNPNAKQGLLENWWREPHEGRHKAAGITLALAECDQAVPLTFLTQSI